MIQLQFQSKLPIRSAVGRRGRINAAIFVASVALAAQILSACSSSRSFPADGFAAYPDLNDPTPTAGVPADQVAQIKADLIQLRDNQERVAARQQALRVGGVGRDASDPALLVSGPVVSGDPGRQPSERVAEIAQQQSDRVDWQSDRLSEAGNGDAQHGRESTALPASKVP